jgi:hypothetical protein
VCLREFLRAPELLEFQTSGLDELHVPFDGED